MDNMEVDQEQGDDLEASQGQQRKDFQSRMSDYIDKHQALQDRTLFNSEKMFFTRVRHKLDTMHLTPSTIIQLLRKSMRSVQPPPYTRVRFMVGLLLYNLQSHSDDPKFWFYAPSANTVVGSINGYLIKSPISIKDVEDDLNAHDYIEDIKEYRPNTKWVFMKFVCLDIAMHKM